MTIFLALYICLMLGIGLYHSRNKNTFRDFVIAGGRQGTGIITLSLLATMVGGSATLGMTSLTAKLGFPAFWWLGVGALGLMLQALLLSQRVRALNACTLPHVAQLTMGAEARTLTALIITVTWTGIIAAQFTALSQIFAVMSGVTDTRALLIVLSLAVIAYTAVGGQLSVLRTDSLQVALIFGGVAVACVVLWQHEPGPQPWWSRLELLNARFGWQDLVSLFLLVGTTYFIGPDIFSRNLSARDGRTARRSTLLAALGLMLFALLITLVSLWAVEHGLSGTENALVLLIRDYLPMPAAILLALGLISALISSADTCLMSAATILEHDFFRQQRVHRVRFFVVLLGSISLAVALLRSDIISLLLAAYSVYAPGVVIPLFVAILCHKTHRLHKGLWLCAVAAGGVCGFAGGVAHMPHLPLVGMGLSAVLTLAALCAPMAVTALRAQRQ